MTRATSYRPIADVLWRRWRHDVETLSALLALCEGNPPVNSPHKGPIMRDSDVSFFITLKKSSIVELSVIWDATTFVWRHSNVTVLCISQLITLNPHIAKIIKIPPYPGIYIGALYHNKYQNITNDTVHSNIRRGVLIEMEVMLSNAMGDIYDIMDLMPGGTWCNENVIITSKRRRDVVLT